MNDDVKLVEDIVERFPFFREMYESHVYDQHGVLAHVFFWELTNEVVDAYLSKEDTGLDWRGVLDFLEERVDSVDMDALGVIRVSFLEYMPYRTQPGHDLIEHLGPNLSRHFRDIRG